MEKAEVPMSYEVDTGTQRAKQIQRDRYYMQMAKAVELRATCLGSRVGAVVVANNRVISIGYSGTPRGFPNCDEGGCISCYENMLAKSRRRSEVSDPARLSGQALDRCICIHAEKHALLAADRFEAELRGATLYTRQSPCFGCLKESVHVGIGRIVYERWYAAKYPIALRNLYIELSQHLTKGDPTNFEAVGGDRLEVESEGQPDAYAVDSDDAVAIEPPYGF